MDLRKGKEGGEKMRGREGGGGRRRRGGGCLSGWVPTPHFVQDGQFPPCVQKHMCLVCFASVTLEWE